MAELQRLKAQTLTAIKRRSLMSRCPMGKSRTAKYRRACSMLLRYYAKGRRRCRMQLSRESGTVVTCTATSHQLPAWRDLSPEERSFVRRASEKTGHTWEKGEDGEILLYRLHDKCFGPRCSVCGYAVCVVCETAVIARCPGAETVAPS